MNPIKEYLYIALTIGLLGGMLWFVHHERAIGEQKVVAAQQAADVKYAAQVAKVEADAKVTTDALQKQLDAALLTPIHPNVVVRMLVPTAPASGAVREDASPSPGGDAGSGSGGGLGEGHGSVDIAGPTEQVLARDKALIDYLQGYILKCQRAGMCQ